MNRRGFVKNISLGTLGLIGLNSFSFRKEYKKITILHTNDTHSRIDPFPKNHKRYANLAGVPARAMLIDSIRKQEPNVLLFDAGDIFQGTPYFNFFGGELELKLMTKMAYDAATMGNHDFDNGVEGFDRVKHHAEFPFLCSNYDFKNTLLDGKTIPHKIFIKEGIKIGVFGVGVKLEGLVSNQLYKETKYLNPIEIAQEQAKYLKEEKECDLVICLSHLGFEYVDDQVSDKVLAAKTNNIDLIIGGHTHTFMEKPEIVQNIEGKKVLINQVGFAGINLGRIDFYIEESLVRPKIQSSILIKN